MATVAWHRIFHPLCGADPLTLARLVARAGQPSPRRSAPFAIAVAASLARLPFTLVEAAAGAIRPEGHATPVFIVGYPRSGTTHLHNLVAASGQFTTVPPVPAALPWESRTLAPIVRRFVDPFLPETRIIDAVKLDPDSPTEDEVALANMCGLSYFHAIYLPRRFRQEYQRGLLFEDVSPRDIAARGRALRRYVAAMSRGGRPLLLKNPAYTATIGWLLSLFPGARIIHIRRNPRDVFASNRRALEVVLAELALQRLPEGELDRTILETYPRVMERLEADCRDLPDARFVDVAFETLVQDPEAEMRRVWDRLALPRREESLAAIGRYVASIHDYRLSRNALSHAQARAVEARWGHLLAAYGTAG